MVDSSDSKCAVVSVLQCVAVCCSVLQCDAVCCSQCVAVCARGSAAIGCQHGRLRRLKVCCSQCVAVCCNVMQCVAM